MRDSHDQPAASAADAAATSAPGDAPADDTLDFEPVPTRHRADGWTPEKQVAFIEALAEAGCVAHAAKAVGMTATAAYSLRRHVAAQSFRMAWVAAIDHATQRLSDTAFARAMHGVVRPVFYRGEQVGERVHYDERLTMFLLRYHDPVRYGAWLDRAEADRVPDGAALALSRWTTRVADDAWAASFGEPRPDRPFMPLRERVEPARAEDIEAAEDARREAEEHAAWQAEIDADDQWDADDSAFDPEGVTTSTTSAPD